MKTKPELVFDKLFYRTCTILQLNQWAKESVVPSQKFGNFYELGEDSFGYEPTYKLHVENFKKFVAELKELNKLRVKTGKELTKLRKKRQEEQDKLHPKTELSEQRAKRRKEAGAISWWTDDPSSEAEYRGKDRMIDEKICKFSTKYKTALEALTFSQFFREHRVYLTAPFVNMGLSPGAGNDRQVFLSFIGPYLDFRSYGKTHIQGPKGGTQAIPSHLLRLAEKMRCKGKGTKAGSLATITDVIMEKMGYSFELPDNKMLKIYDNISRTLTRHFARIKQSRPK